MKKICFLILVLCSSMMMGCAAWNTPINASEEFGVKVAEKSEQEEITEASTEASTEDVAAVVFEKELKETDNPRIAEILNVSGIHSDGGSQEHYHYQIPQFNAYSESAKVVNKRIENDLSAIIEPEATNISGGYSLVTHSVTYEIFEYGDITAIVVTVPYPNDCKDYLAYTYDFQNDKELMNTELLGMNRMTEEEFVTEICRLQEEDFIELAKSGPNPMADQEIINGYIANVNAYATVELPMYFDGKGTLQVYVPFASIAGADWYYQLRQF